MGRTALQTVQLHKNVTALPNSTRTFHNTQPGYLSPDLFWFMIKKIRYGVKLALHWHLKLFKQCQTVTANVTVK
jgi:hypothetical protein